MCLRVDSSVVMSALALQIRAILKEQSCTWWLSRAHSEHVCPSTSSAAPGPCHRHRMSVVTIVTESIFAAIALHMLTMQLLDVLSFGFHSWRSYLGSGCQQRLAFGGRPGKVSSQCKCPIPWSAELLIIHFVHGSLAFSQGILGFAVPKPYDTVSNSWHACNLQSFGMAVWSDACFFHDRWGATVWRGNLRWLGRLLRFYPELPSSRPCLT